MGSWNFRDDIEWRDEEWVGLVCDQRGVELLWKNQVYGSICFRYDGDTSGVCEVGGKGAFGFEGDAGT